MISEDANPRLDEIIRNKLCDMPGIGSHELSQVSSCLGPSKRYNRFMQLTNSTIKNVRMTKVGEIKINGPISFDIVVINLECMLKRKYTKFSQKYKRYKYKTQKINVTSARFLGLKVVDIFKLYNQMNELTKENQENQKDQEFKNDKGKLYKKILKKYNDPDKFSVLALEHLSLIEKESSKENYTIDNFANQVIIFSGISNSLYHLFFRLPYTSNYYQKDNLKNCEKIKIDYLSHCYNSVNSMLSIISSSYIQSLINIFYFNMTDPYEDQNTVIEFDEPRSLMSILEEYDSEAREYHLLKKMIKPNECPTMVFSNVKKFDGRNAEIIKVDYFDKVYFETWDVESSFSNISSIIREKYDEKRFKDRHDSDPYYYRCGDKLEGGKKKNYFYNLIKDELESFRYC